ncbi:Rpn family recombination-promoting nuclease/putative transposase [Allocoleopsis sp.]|uniref:Rpn family recombination-promoting nuclease/putative transposase n=1 Tax=Allocoleopsis sp. TaxID=3088169 RepID=UPI002FD68DCA
MKTDTIFYWGAVVLYPTQEIDTGDIKHYREFFASQRVRRVYLDEFGSTLGQSIGIATLKLVVEPEETAGAKARVLINQARLEIADEAAKRELIQLIERIIVYKFPQKTPEEIERMLGLGELKQTRFYQEVFQEGIEEGERRGKLKAVPPMLTLGLSVEQIAEGLGLDVELVRQAAASHLLASERSVEQVAEALGLDVEVVRQMEASKTQNDEPAEEE